ncbi:MAG: purine-nucleoside phosphorylase [Myxococcota bacterium]
MDETTFDRVEELARALRDEMGMERPRVGVILGSGLGSFAEGLESSKALSYSELPNMPTSAVPGHSGRMVGGMCEGVPVAVMQGRVHAYEGWSMDEVVLGARALCRLGIEVLVVTNAAGGIHADLRPGDLMRITDHINLTGRNPLQGPNDDRLGPRFPDMSRAYDCELGDLLEEVAMAGRQSLRCGVYACLPGPSYETPAEIMMLRVMGADAVGMSTVPEVIVARHMGVRCVGISVITNLAAGISPSDLSHAEVKETADRVNDVFVDLLKRFIGRIGETLPADQSSSAG